MKKYRFISAMLAMVLVFGMVLSGCATTTNSINFAMDTQPVGVYKQAVISARSSFFGRDTALQRFYEQYPSTQYEVVAIEKISPNYWRLLAGAGGGALLGGVVGGVMAAAAAGEEGAYSAGGMALGVGLFTLGGAGLGTLGGYIWHWMQGDSPSYVVTYVERQGVVPLTTQGPQG